MNFLFKFALKYITNLSDVRWFVSFASVAAFGLSQGRLDGSSPRNSIGISGGFAMMPDAATPWMA